MLFTKDQVNELLNIIEYHHTFLAGTNLGVDVLSPEDIIVLRSYGVELSDFNEDITLFDQLYHFGKLIGILKGNDGLLIDFADYVKYIKSGQYIPLTERERFELEIAKRKTYTHLKGLKERVKQSTEASIIEAERKLYEKTVKEGMIEGVEKRKSVQAIISDMGHSMKTWKHDWGRIVETEGNNIFQMGKAMTFLKKDPEARVFKTVYNLACRHCIKLQLKNGLGSEPIVLPLKTVMANGDNIGKKVEDWKFIVGSTHPWCRCDMKMIPKGYVWNETTKRFELPKNFVHKVERKGKAKIMVGDKVFYV